MRPCFRKFGFNFRVKQAVLRNFFFQFFMPNHDCPRNNCPSFLVGLRVHSGDKGSLFCLSCYLRDLRHSSVFVCLDDLCFFTNGPGCEQHNQWRHWTTLRLSHSDWLESFCVVCPENRLTLPARKGSCDAWKKAGSWDIWIHTHDMSNFLP